MTPFSFFAAWAGAPMVQIVERSLARDRSQRFGSADEMASMLQHWLSTSGTATDLPIARPSGAPSQRAPSFGAPAAHSTGPMGGPASYGSPYGGVAAVGVSGPNPAIGQSAPPPAFGSSTGTPVYGAPIAAAPKRSGSGLVVAMVLLGIGALAGLAGGAVAIMSRQDEPSVALAGRTPTTATPATSAGPSTDSITPSSASPAKPGAVPGVPGHRNNVSMDASAPRNATSDASAPAPAGSGPRIGQSCTNEGDGKYDVHLECHSGRWMCQDHYESCGHPDRCFNLMMNPDNCGKCGNTCERNEICSGFHCRTCTLNGEGWCGDRCLNLNTDPNNCGRCNNSCFQTTFGKKPHCVAGQCSEKAF
jgi:hypothetical protein